MILQGEATRLTRESHGIAYSAARDEFYVGQPVASSVVIFKGGVNGDAKPARVLVGSKTRLHNPWGIGVDDRDHEISVADFTSNSILTYRSDAGGNASPIRVLSGPKTKLFKPVGVVIDPKRNLMIVTADGIYFYNRTAQGNTPPLGMIKGPRTGIISTWHAALYKDLLFVSVSNVDWRPAYDYAGYGCRPGLTRPPAWVWEHTPGFIGVWKVTDRGDVPPRAVIRGQETMLHDPGGITIDPKEGEVIVGDTSHNGIYTFSVPQFFELAGGSTGGNAGM